MMQMMQAREQVELPFEVRSMSRYSSCDFQVDDDERIEDQYNRMNHPGNELHMIEYRQQEQGSLNARRTKMSINQSSYSIALMQPKRNQKKKVNYEGRPQMMQVSLNKYAESDQLVAQSMIEDVEDEKAGGPAGQ